MFINVPIDAKYKRLYGFASFSDKHKQMANHMLLHLLPNDEITYRIDDYYPEVKVTMMTRKNYRVIAVLPIAEVVMFVIPRLLGYDSMMLSLDHYSLERALEGLYHDFIRRFEGNNIEETEKENDIPWEKELEDSKNHQSSP